MKISGEASIYLAERDRTLRAFERGFIKQVLRDTGGNVKHAAAYAGINRTTFYRIMERCGIRRHSEDQR